MKFLENRTHDSKREMDIMDALDELRNITRQNAKVSHEDLFQYLSKREYVQLTDSEKEDIKELKKAQKLVKIDDKKTEIVLNQTEFGEGVGDEEGEKKKTAGNGLWDLDTQLVVKKKKSKEDEVKSVVAEEEKVLLKPGQLCDYSDSDEE